MTEDKPTQTTQATQTKVVETADGSIKITQPKGHRNAGINVLLESDDIVRNQAKGFANFLQEYAVVGLALGFIVGQQANAVVKQFVTSFIDPLSKVWFGQNLSDRKAILHHGATPVAIPWGAFVYVLLEFFLVLLSMYAVIKIFKLDRFIKKKDKKSRR